MGIHGNHAVNQDLTHPPNHGDSMVSCRHLVNAGGGLEGFTGKAPRQVYTELRSPALNSALDSSFWMFYVLYVFYLSMGLLQQHTKPWENDFEVQHHAASFAQQWPMAMPTSDELQQFIASSSIGPRWPS